jgi:hypothetical protein
MKILAEKSRIEAVGDRLRAQMGFSGIEFESFDLASRDYPRETFDLIDSCENSVVLFCDLTSAISSDLAKLAARILDHPDDVLIAVRYPEISEYLRGFEIHADIISMDYSVQSVYRSVDSFVLGNDKPRIFVLGGETDWTLGIGREFASHGYLIDDLTVSAVEMRFKTLLIGGAYDAILVESIAELEGIERMCGSSIEAYSGFAQVMTSNPVIKLHLAKRGVKVESLATLAEH